MFPLLALAAGVDGSENKAWARDSGQLTNDTDVNKWAVLQSCWDDCTDLLMCAFQRGHGHSWTWNTQHFPSSSRSISWLLAYFQIRKKKKTFITTLKNIESGSIPFSSTWEIIEWMESKCFWRVKAAKRVVYVTKDGLQISWVSEIDDGIKLVLEQGHGCLEREAGRWMKNTWCRRWLWEGWIMRSKDFVGIKWWNENGWCGAWWRVWVLWRPCIAMQRWGRRHPLMAVTNLTNSSGSLAKYLPRPPP